MKDSSKRKTSKPIENPSYSYTDEEIQLILQSSCLGRTADDNGKYRQMFGLVDWMAKECHALFKEDEDFPSADDILYDDLARDEWEPYKELLLGKLFPPYGHRTVCRKSGLKDDKEEWLLFSHPHEAHTRGLVGSQNRVPGIRVVIEKRFSEYHGSDVYEFLAIGFKPHKLGGLLESDGILHCTFDITEDGSYPNRREIPVKLRNWLGSLSNSRMSTNRRLTLWREYIDWEKDKIKREEWGGLLLNVEPPKPGDINWKYEIEIPNILLSKLKKARNDRLHASPIDNSDDDSKWIRSEKSQASFGRKGDEEFEIGVLKDVQVKKEYKKNSIVILKVSPPNKEEPLNVPSAEPREYFIINEIARELIQIERQEKAIDRLRDMEAWHNNLHEWIFNINEAGEGIKPLPELKYDLLPNSQLNENQLIAVRKALNVPDVCLIQGPPGTGKTTVIAEIINQATQEGLKVLLASQTNLAVDNALGRLGHVPNVRPIRRHAKSAAMDPEAERFIESKVVKEFFIPSIREHCARVQKKDDSLLELRKHCHDAKIKLRHLKDQWKNHKSEIQNLSKDKDKRAKKIKDIEAKLSSQQEELDLFEKNRSFIFDNQLENLPLKIQTALNITSTVLSQVKEKEYCEKAKPIIDEMLISCNDKDKLSGNLKPEIIALRKERENFDLTTTDTSELERLLTINKQLEELEKSDIKGIWPQFSGNIHRLLMRYSKLLNKPMPKELKKLSEYIQKTKPPADLINHLDLVIRWMEKELKDIESRMPSLIEEVTESTKIIIQRYEKSLKEKKAEYENNAETLHKEKVELDKISSANQRIKDLMEKLKNDWDNVFEDLPSEITEKNLHIESSNVYNLERAIDKWIKDNSTSLEVACRWSEIRHDWLKEIQDPSRDVLEDLQSIYLDLVNIEGVTTSYSARWKWYNRYIESPFDLVIIDEVSKATPPELLQALLLGKRAILVGDHKQLPPTFRHHPKKGPKMEEEISAREMDDNERLIKYEKMVTSNLFKEYFIDADDSIKQGLTTQYRMHSQIMRCVNSFYDHQLVLGLSSKQEQLLKSHDLTIVKTDNWGTFQKGSELIIPSKHVVWIDSTFTRNGKYNPEIQWKNGSSKANKREVLIAGKILDTIDGQVRKRKKEVPESNWKSDPMLKHLENNLLPVGFITFYGGQIAQFKETLLLKDNEKGENPWFRMRRIWPDLTIKVDSVDRFQGGERPVIIVSTVVSQPIPKKMNNVFHKNTNPNNKNILRLDDLAKGGIPRPTTGFIRSFERINVALSRAQNLLIIIGNRWGIEKVKVPIPSDKKKGKAPQIKVYEKIQNGIEKIGGMLDGREIC